MAKRRKIPQNDLGIPEYEMESLARMLLPILQMYLASDEGKRDWKEWQARKKCTLETADRTLTKERSLRIKTKG